MVDSDGGDNNDDEVHVHGLALERNDDSVRSMEEITQYRLTGGVHNNPNYLRETDDDNEVDNASTDNEIEATAPPLHRPPLERNDHPIGKHKVVRRKKTVDIETGNSLEHTCSCRGICDSEHNQPMDPILRRWKTFLRGRAEKFGRQNLPTSNYQYRLTSRKRRRGLRGLLRQAAEEDFQVIRGLNFIVANYVLWTLQTHVFLVFLSAAAMYIVMNLLFGILIYGMGIYEPRCIDLNGEDFNLRKHTFEDAFSLSWQTFTTTGYGAIRPLLSIRGHHCALTNMLVALESFTGILFVGFCTAVMFGKIARLQADANVQFSDPIVVRYGHGVRSIDDPSDCSSEKGNKEIKEAECDKGNVGDIPCPVLEFRILNLLHDQMGGEICDASVNVVATTTAQRTPRSEMTSMERDGYVVHQQQIQSVSSLAGMTTTRGSSYESHDTRAPQRNSLDASGVIHKSSNIVQKIHRSLLSPADKFQPQDTPVSEPLATLKTTTGDLLSPMKSKWMSLSVDEEPSSALVPRRVFSKLEIETDKHPFFKRVWTIRHILNEKSPLLSEKVRASIVNHRGFWPPESNSYQEVRKRIHFHQIIVNFTGTVNVSGNTVYAQKLFDHANLNIGYRFADMLLISGVGQLIVDGSLLNDVTEQQGGGAEPFTNVVDASSSVDAAAVVAAVTKGSANVVKQAADAAVAGAHVTIQVAANVADNSADALKHAGLAIA